MVYGAASLYGEIIPGYALLDDAWILVYLFGFCIALFLVFWLDFLLLV
jgi:hypothetical protein